jgi:uncharacterized membrane protein
MTKREQPDGFNVLELLVILLVVLKLCGVIDLSWWIITAPIWIPFAVLLIVVAVLGVFAACLACYMWIRDLFTRPVKHNL